MKDAKVAATSSVGARAQTYEEVKNANADDPAAAAASPAARTRPIITIEEAPDDEEYELQDTSKNEALRSVSNPNARNGFQHNKADDLYENQASKPRYAVMINWNFGYFKTTVGFLRLLFMLGVALSLICLSNAGTEDEDVLQLEAKTRIRLHVFGCIFILLVGILICVLEVTSIKNSLPYRWDYMDIFSTFILGTLCIITSTLLLHALNADPEELENGLNGDDGSGNGSGSGSGNGSGSGSGNGMDDDDDDDEEGMPRWSRGLLAVSAVFGYFGTLVSVFLIVFKCFAHKDAKAYSRQQRDIQEEITMVTTSNS